MAGNQKSLKKFNTKINLGVITMRLGFGLSQEQTQKLVITPELRLAIKILQFSAVELAEYVDEQLVENPVLEVEQVDADIESIPAADDKELQDAGEVNFDWEQYFRDAGEIRAEKIKDRETENWGYDSLIPQVSTLHDHLMFQLALIDLNKEEKTVAEFLIGNIDDNGYLNSSVEEAAVHYGLGQDTAEKVLELIQTFDPPGVGARDLRECLLIQCAQRGIQNELISKIITNHLNEIAEGKIMKVAKNLGVSLGELQEAIDFLKLFEPKPGRRFAQTDETRYITPDIVVEKIGNEYVILVNDITVPRLSINPYYREILKGNQEDQEGRKYLESKMNSAVWLVKSIEQRRLTLYKVARCLVDFQTEFLEKGIKSLKPLTMKQVAEQLGIHESTVSRATAGKYMQTPRGIFELKFFFTSGVSNVQGDSTSAEAVKRMIKELIDKEDTKKPLSDQKIAAKLQELGVEVSRRTIAKYRDEMGIVSTTKRKRY